MKTLSKFITVTSLVGSMAVHGFSTDKCTNLTIDGSIIAMNLFYGVEVITNQSKCDTSRIGKFYLQRNMKMYQSRLHQITTNFNGIKEAVQVYNLINRMKHDGNIFGYSVYQLCGRGAKRCPVAGMRESQTKKPGKSRS
jgi:hypothetical protein